MMVPHTIKELPLSLLKMDLTLNDIVMRLSKQLPAKKIYLFGSRATAKHQQDSDYDILIIVPDTCSTDIGPLTDLGHYSLKSLKAYLFYHNKPIPRTHDLRELSVIHDTTKPIKT